MKILFSQKQMGIVVSSQQASNIFWHLVTCLNAICVLICRSIQFWNVFTAHMLSPSSSRVSTRHTVTVGAMGRPCRLQSLLSPQQPHSPVSNRGSQPGLILWGIWQSWRHFWWSRSGGGQGLLLASLGRPKTKHPSMHRTAPTAKNYPAQHVSRIDAEKPLS